MKTADRILQWLPRIICILAILFISMFALDVFSPDFTVWQQIRAFLVHLIPSFVLLAILLIAWKWEKAGGIIMLVTGAILCIVVFHLNYSQRRFSLVQSLVNVSLICLPFLIAGILFILSHYRKHRKQLQV